MRDRRWFDWSQFGIQQPVFFCIPQENWKNTALCPKNTEKIFWQIVKLEWKFPERCVILFNGNMSFLYTGTYKEQVFHGN